MIQQEILKAKIKRNVWETVLSIDVLILEVKSVHAFSHFADQSQLYYLLLPKHVVKFNAKFMSSLYAVISCSRNRHFESKFTSLNFGMWPLNLRNIALISWVSQVELNSVLCIEVVNRYCNNSFISVVHHSESSLQNCESPEHISSIQGLQDT